MQEKTLVRFASVLPYLINRSFNQSLSGLFINVVPRSWKACSQMYMCKSEQDTKTCYGLPLKAKRYDH